MTTFTNLKQRTSEQHIEFGTSRCNHDFKDLSNILEWFNEHEPFDLNEQRLRSLSSGLTATDDGLNCDKTEQVGAKIQALLDNVSIANASIKRSEQVRTLDHLYTGILVDKHKVHINPNILFSRLIAIIQRD